MVVQTYCLRADVESLWSPGAVLRAIDDDEDGTASPEEERHVARAIERGANRMNASLEVRYSLASLAGNGWCRDCNAALAAYALATRRGNPAPDHLQEAYEGFLSDLAEIRRGALKVPQVPDSFDALPAATNFDVDLGRRRAKVRRIDETSTGSPPPPGRKQHGADE